MAKKGAKSSGGSRAREKTRNQAMAATLPPSPTTWRRRAWDWPYHNNLGTCHERQNPVAYKRRRPPGLEDD